jgi:tetratricopeptide (TPR) repeat protein
MQDARFQTALELAKDLYRDVPAPEHKELVEEAYLGRARQLHNQGAPRDAVTVLDAAQRFANRQDLPWLEKVAEGFAVGGEVRRALALLEPFAGSPAQAKVLCRAADTAVRQEAAGRYILPESLHADFDRILQAAAQLEAGQDDAARETLQGIGLRSPFLEWKLFLRGLQAYCTNDDARALENWGRLNPERLPARLAAPLRFRIDRAFQASQPPEAQRALQRQADRLQGSEIVGKLRELQGALAGQTSMARAFRLAEAVLPALRRPDPHLASRLAACFYWMVVANGGPEDVPRFSRVFGAPPDDPALARLRAMNQEHMGELAQAHEAWQQFEGSVAANPQAWPNGQAERVRALVWYHMGQNAASFLEDIEDLDDDLNGPFRRHRRRSRIPGLKPPAETCFQNSLKLAPDQLGTHAALFQYHRKHRHHAKAEQAAKALLERFPEHGPTLESLADLHMETGRYGEALDLLERALRANPLSRQLRNKIGSAHLFRARSHAEAGRFDEARADYQAALALHDGEDYPALCKWAACEFKAGNPERAEELFDKALAEVGSRLAVAFNMVIEAIRLKLPRPLKQRFDREFNAALAEPATPAGAAAILSTAAAHRRAGVTYFGQKTHEKKALTYVQKALDVDWTEPQLVAVCRYLLELKALKPLREFAALGQRRFPQAPLFPLLEADSYMAVGPERCQIYRVQPLLAKARELAEKMPRDPQQQELLESIREREQMVRSLNPFLDLFGGGVNPFFGDFEDGDDYGDDDDGW